MQSMTEIVAEMIHNETGDSLDEVTFANLVDATTESIVSAYVAGLCSGSAPAPAEVA